jgi:hypothetical protein
MVDVLAPFGKPDVTATHGQIEARFIEENELLNRDLRDGLLEGLPLGYNGRA